MRSIGYQVVARYSSVEALELFRAQPTEFDLVITDMTMPNLTGIELAEELVKIRRDIPVILCTGFGNAVFDEGCTAAIREVVMKPVTRGEIAAAIRRVLDRK